MVNMLLWQTNQNLVQIESVWLASGGIRILFGIVLLLRKGREFADIVRREEYVRGYPNVEEE